MGQTQSTLTVTKKEQKCFKLQFSSWEKLDVCGIVLEKNLSTFLRFCVMMKNNIEKNEVKKIGLLTDLLFLPPEVRFMNKIK